MSNSSSSGVYASGNSNVDIFNCTLNTLDALRESNVHISNSTILDYAKSSVFSVNCSVARLEPDFVSYWNFEFNCSVLVAPSGWAPNFTTKDTEIGGWSFDFDGCSNATISNSELKRTFVRQSAVISVYNSSFSHGIYAYSNSRIYAYDSTTYRLVLLDNSKIWAVNSTSSVYPDIYSQSELYVHWYLNVHVLDSIGQAVPSANVTATYPNATIAESELADAYGWARLTLMEMTLNATGEYHVGNHTAEATYESYSNSTTVNMIGNQQISLTLEDFVIPEFPSFIIMPLFMITALLAVIVYRRKRSM